jgi:general secretion pathway protein A
MGSPDPRFFYGGRNYQAALFELQGGIESHRGLLVLTGEPGTGKTLLIRQILQWLSSKKFSTSYIFHSHLNSAGLFEFILNDFGIKTESSRKTEFLAALHRWLQVRQAEGDSPIVVIDEAQALSVRALSELSLLLNLESSSGKLLQVLLVGQTELEEKLRRAELRQLRQRIAVRCRLPLLSLEETEEYIVTRLRIAGAARLDIFPPEALQTLYSYAQGVPRVINLLCEKALQAAYAENQTVVTPLIMRHAASGFDFAFEPHGAPLPEFSLQTSLTVPLAGPDVTPFPLPAAQVATPLPSPQPVFESVLGLSQRSSESPTMEPRGEARPKPNVTVLSPKPAEPTPESESTHDLEPEDMVEARSRDFLATHADAAQSQPVDRPETPFARYWREVGESFVRDCRYFMGAFQTQAAADGKVLLMKRYDLKRDFVAPVSRWLNKPVAFNSGRKPSAKSHQAGRGSF